MTARRAVFGIVILLALVGAACGSSTTGGSAGTTSSATSAAPPCNVFGSTSPAAGGARLDPGRPVALLSNVQVQASACVDEVAFLFIGGMGSWSVSYGSAPFVEDPSGRTVDVAGKAFLQVRLDRTSGVDLQGDEPHVIYNGPRRMSPPAPSDVVEVRQLGDFEAVMSWVIGLPDERRYQAFTRDQQLVVRLSKPDSSATTCRLDGSSLDIGYPSTWYAELSDRWACRFFDDAPFVVHPATDDFRWKVTATVADTSAGIVVARIASGSSEITTNAITVAGLPASRVDVTSSGDGLLPPGWTFRTYVIDAGPRAVTITGAAARSASTIAANAAAVDSIVELVTVR